jgi:hypothetical protein
MSQEKLKEEYNKEAMTLLNTAARADLNEGNNKTLFVLSQGEQDCRRTSRLCSYCLPGKVFNIWETVQ